MIQWLRERIQRRGQAMVEMALILVLIAVAAMVALQLAGNQVLLTYQDIEEAVMNPDDPGQTATYTCPGGYPAVLHGHKYHCQ